MFNYTYLLKYSYVASPQAKKVIEGELYYSCDDYLKGEYLVSEDNVDDTGETIIIKRVFFGHVMGRKWRTSRGNCVRVIVSQTFENSYAEAQSRESIPYFEDGFYRYIEQLSCANEMLKHGGDFESEDVDRIIAGISAPFDIRRYMSSLYSFGFNPINGHTDFVRTRQIFRSAINVLIGLFMQKQLSVPLNDFSREDLRSLQKKLTEHLLLIQDAIFDTCDVIKSGQSIREGFGHYEESYLHVTGDDCMNLIPIFKLTQDSLIENDRLYSRSAFSYYYRNVFEKYNRQQASFSQTPKGSKQQYYKGIIVTLTEEQVRNLYNVLLKYHWIDDTISVEDFVIHLLGSDNGYIPTSKIIMREEYKALVILMDALGAKCWKPISQRFGHYKNNTEATFYASIKQIAKNFKDQKKNNNADEKTLVYAQTVVNILNASCEDADDVIKKTDHFYDPFI